MVSGRLNSGVNQIFLGSNKEPEKTQNQFSKGCQGGSKTNESKHNSMTHQRDQQWYNLLFMWISRLS